MAKKAMKKKKVAKKTVSRKKVVRKKVARVSKQSISKYNSRLALRNLILFALLSLIFFMLYTVSGNELYQYMFYLLSLVLGFIAVAFLIVLLIIVFSRGKVVKRR